MTGGQAVIRSLKAEKVEHMFGLIGSATIEVFDALYEEKKIKFIGVRDEKTVVSLMGDGGFGMTISELSTAVEYGINTVTIVMNNKSWGAEKAYQRDFYGERYIGADISSPPFDKVAELYGAKGFSVERTSEISEAVNAALKCGKPAVVDIAVDPKALYSFRRDSFKHREK